MLGTSDLTGKLLGQKDNDTAVASILGNTMFHRTTEWQTNLKTLSLDMSISIQKEKCSRHTIKASARGQKKRVGYVWQLFTPP